MFARDNVDRGRTRRVYQASARQKISLWVEMVVVEERISTVCSFINVHLVAQTPILRFGPRESLRIDHPIVGLMQAH
jgi:hypothetical protein